MSDTQTPLKGSLDSQREMLFHTSSSLSGYNAEYESCDTPIIPRYTDLSNSTDSMVPMRKLVLAHSDSTLDDLEESTLRSDIISGLTNASTDKLKALLRESIMLMNKPQLQAFKDILHRK